MYIDPSVQEKVAALYNRQPKTIHDSLGIEFTHLAKEKVCATLPVDQRTHQPFGLLHGGASVVLAESCASIGAWLNIDEINEMAVGLEINANHIRAVRSGFIIAEASPIHLGTSTHVWAITMVDDAAKTTCIARCTMMIKKTKP